MRITHNTRRIQLQCINDIYAHHAQQEMNTTPMHQRPTYAARPKREENSYNVSTTNMLITHNMRRKNLQCFNDLHAHHAQHEQNTITTTYLCSKHIMRIIQLQCINDLFGHHAKHKKNTTPMHQRPTYAARTTREGHNYSESMLFNVKIPTWASTVRTLLLSIWFRYAWLCQDVV